MRISRELESELAALPPQFWGSVELIIQNGELIVIKTVTTRKLQERNTRDAQNKTY